MRCVYCGAELEDSANECTSCGKQVKKFVGYERETKIIENNEKIHNEKPLSKKAIIIIIASVVALIVGVFLIIALLSSNDSDSNYSASSTSDSVVDIAIMDVELNTDKILKQAQCGLYNNNGRLTIGNCDKEGRGNDNYLVTVSGAFYPTDQYGDEHKVIFTFEVTVVGGRATNERCIMADRQY